MTPVELSGDIGLIAICLLTLNILLGLLVSVKFNPSKHWPHRRINIFKIHNWTGYVALALVFLHPLLLLLSTTAGFRWWDILFPVWSPTQPLENTLGAIALYSLVFVVVTSYFRVQLGRKVWKRFHYVAYFAAVFFFVHGILTDPRLKNSPVDPFDAEKVLVEVCLLLVCIGVGWRIWYARHHRKGGKTI